MAHVRSGSRRCHSVACWNAEPSANRRASVPACPTSCMATGSPSASKPAGRLSAQPPIWLTQRVNCPRGDVRSSTESRAGALQCTVGRSSTSSAGSHRRKRSLASTRAARAAAIVPESVRRACSNRRRRSSPNALGSFSNRVRCTFQASTPMSIPASRVRSTSVKDVDVFLKCALRRTKVFAASSRACWTAGSTGTG